MYSILFSSFFVAAVYVWRPFIQFKRKDNPHPDKTGKHIYFELEENQRKEVFDIKMKCFAVMCLCAMAAFFLLVQSDLSVRPEVTILKWFGLAVDTDVLLACVGTLSLNTILFMGEIFQIVKDMR